MKKLLILGANPETVSLILKAKEMGYYTIVTDYDPNAYAKQFADEAANINATDVDNLVDLAVKKQVDGVLVGVAEALLPAYCDVCERLNFPAFSTKEIFSFMTRKDLFKEKCREYNVPVIHEYDSNQIDSVIFPVIVKPVDSCSSKGISICYTREELNKGIDHALKYSKTGNYIIEDYLSGDEVISYYVIQNGNPIFVGMCDRYTCKPNSNLVQLPVCYIFPSKHIDSYITQTDNSVKNMIRGLGLENGSLFLQCFVDKDGIIRVYEPGYRLNGAQEHIIISKVSGIDAKELYINYALTGSVSNSELEALSNPKPNSYSCKLSPLIRTGKIEKIIGLDKISEIEDVISINPSYREGDEVQGEGTLKQIICRFFIVSDTKTKLCDAINRIQSLLKVYDDKGNDMIVGLFDTKIIE